MAAVVTLPAAIVGVARLREPASVAAAGASSSPRSKQPRPPRSQHAAGRKDQAGSPRNDQLLFIFDGGVFPHDQIRRLTPRDPEISDVAAVSVEEARQLLRADMADHLNRALHAMTTT